MMMASAPPTTTRTGLLDNLDPEMRRILSMPARLEGPSEYARQYVLPNAVHPASPDRPFELFPIQAYAVWEFAQTGGLFAPVAVGYGKTLISLLCATVGWVEQGHRRIMLLIPAPLVRQLQSRDIGQLASIIQMPYRHRIFFLTGSLAERKRIARNAERGVDGLYIMSYSMLSCRDAEANLAAVKPTLMILDECHKVKNAEAARTQRLGRYVDEHLPRGVCLSGTITSQSILDYAHLVHWCCDQNCPLPLNPQSRREWADIIDTDGSFYPTYQIKKMLTWARQQPLKPMMPGRNIYPDSRAGARRAYNLRFQTSPGVAATSTEKLGVSLIFSNPADPPQSNEELESHVYKCRELLLAPNGDEITEQIHTWNWLYQLSAGFYYDTFWPDPPKPGQEMAIDRHETLMEYRRQQRRWLSEHAMAGCDTPLLLTNAIDRTGETPCGDGGKLVALRRKLLEFPEGLPERKTIVRWVDTYKIDYARRWASKHKRGLIWYYHNAVGQAVAKAIPGSVFCPAGKASNALLAEAEKLSDRVVVLSIKAHSEGKNLQYAFRDQLVLQWPRSAPLAEQMLGRTHRNGQKADELVVDTLHATHTDQLVVSACWRDAEYIQQSTGNLQKMLYGSYDPPITFMPRSVLEECQLTEWVAE